MIKMQVFEGNGKVFGNVTIKQTGIKLGGKCHIGYGDFPVQLPGIFVGDGIVMELAESHYEITPGGENKKVIATIFGEEYTGEKIIVKGKVITGVAVQKTNESAAILAGESKAQQTAGSVKTVQPQSVSNIVQNPNLSVLHRSAADNHTGVMNDAIDRGVPVDIETPEKWTPLHIAAAQGHRGAVKLLLYCDANAEKMTGDGRTAAQLATSLEIKTIIEEHIRNSKKTKEAQSQVSLTKCLIANSVVCQGASSPKNAKLANNDNASADAQVADNNVKRQSI